MERSTTERTGNSKKRFGPFEFDPRNHELTKHGIRLKLQEQPLQVLAVLLEQAGRIVPREELQRRLWPDGTFVDYEQSLNKAVNKLREALRDSAASPRFIETLPRRGYRFIGQVEGEPTPAGDPDPLPARPRVPKWIPLAGAAFALLVLVGAFAIWLLRSKAPAELQLRRLTSDSGLSTDPALSTDGKLLAYASDRAGEGNLDIYVRQVGGGEPIRLTRDPADESEPAFSPDGTLVAFRSEADGGGIHLVPALGGAPRRLAALGRRPRFSPDGQWVAYWIGPPSVAVTQPGIGRVFVVPSTGGPPRQACAGFVSAAYPIWLPDGNRLLFLGNRDGDPSIDWWVASLEGGPAARTGALASAQKRNFDIPFSALVPGDWDAANRAVVFSASAGDTTNLWRIPVPLASDRVAGPPERLTSGTAQEDHPAVAAASGGRSSVAFASLTINVDIWSLPLDANSGTAGGPPIRLTQGLAVDHHPLLVSGGREMLFQSDRSGRTETWKKQLVSGQESPMPLAPVRRGNVSADQLVVSVSPDGSRFAAQSSDGGTSIIAASGALERSVPPIAYPHGWSSDGRYLLLNGLRMLDVASGNVIPLAGKFDGRIAQAQFSPGDRWIAFNRLDSPGPSRIYVVPFRGERSIIERRDWIPVTGGESWDDKPRWSSDGRRLYMLSERDGYRCIWAQEMDPVTRRPVGSPLAVYHSHGAQRALLYVDIVVADFSVGRDRILFAMGERTGNIWLAEWKRR
jgi:Tol biopolymer transport system component/DNA-binding winged helix-turn-helix (wHTH) protein